MELTEFLKKYGPVKCQWLKPDILQLKAQDEAPKLNITFETRAAVRESDLHHLQPLIIWLETGKVGLTMAAKPPRATESYQEATQKLDKYLQESRQKQAKKKD